MTSDLIRGKNGHKTRRKNDFHLLFTRPIRNDVCECNDHHNLFLIQRQAEKQSGRKSNVYCFVLYLIRTEKSTFHLVNNNLRKEMEKKNSKRIETDKKCTYRNETL